MKRRASQERDEADARTQADARREQLLAQLRDRETSYRQASVPPVPDADAAAAANADAEPADASDPGDPAEES
ncbi:MAG: hypothetical protein WED12_06845 [Chloroflexota bacterium]